MLPQELADYLGITSNTIRRWCEIYHAFLSPTASPPRGTNRVLTDLDTRVLSYVSYCRDLNQPFEQIALRLQAMRDDDWRDLPEVPWPQPKDAIRTISVPAAAARADEMVTVAILQRDLEATRYALEASQDRVATLETEMAALRASQTSTEAEKQEMRLELERARGQAAELKARLDAYGLAYGMGREKPLPLALVIAVTALAVAVLVIVLLIVVRLVL